MNDSISISCNEQRCPKFYPLGARCENKRVCTISYAEKSNPDGEVWLDKVCILHGQNYIDVLMGKYDLAWVKMEFDD